MTTTTKRTASRTAKPVAKKTSTKKATKPATRTAKPACSITQLFTGLAAGEFDARGVLVTATPQYLVLFGLDESSLGQLTFDQVARSAQLTQDSVLRSLDKQSFTVEAERTTKQNDLKWVRSQFVPAKSTGHDVAGFVEIAEDVTEATKESVDLRSQMHAIRKTQAVIEFTLDGTILDANDNFLQTVGYSRDEVVGKHHRLFMSPQAAQSPEYAGFWQSLRNGECQSGEFRRIAKNGKEVWIQANYTPVLDLQGKPYKVVKFATDITKQREHSLSKAMLENMAASITFADANNIITYANPAAINLLRPVEKHLPVRADQIMGQSIDVFHKNPHHQRSLVADPKNFPFKGNIRVGDDYFTLKASRITSETGAFVGTLVSWENVTEQLANERAVREGAERERLQSEELTRKVTVVLENVNAMAQGNFDAMVPDLGSDAVGQVGQALNQAIRAINGALTEVRGVSTTVSAAATQLTSASRDISAGAQSQASSLEETASSLEEITSTVKQNSDNAQQARQLAVSSRDVAEKGGDVVGEAVQAMGEINQSSKKIADIITTIDEIAFQTNLLALNAAVEAARAGEQGRGFAVVASEVRNLAQRSASAAKEIKALIQDSVRKVEVGTDLVNRSGSTLNEIVNSVKRVTDIVAEIAAASKEQLTGIEQVNRAVSQMDRVTQSNAAQTEEMSGTADSLLSHALQLSDLVGRFQLLSGETGAPVAPVRHETAKPVAKPAAKMPALSFDMKCEHSKVFEF